MKIAIVGGHLSPALTVIEALPKDTQIVFIGRKHALEGDKALSLEYQTITALNIPFENLETGRLQRKITKKTFPSLLKMPAGFLHALSILKKHKPDVIVGFGGYLQIPIAFAAYILQIPIIIHEQTMRAGIANKITAKFAKTICISWPQSAKYFPKDKTILTGLPLRRTFSKKTPYNKFSTLNSQLSTHDSQLSPFKSQFKSSISILNSQFSILVTGGSLGAHAINILIEGIIEKLLKKYNVVHQTGDSQEFKDFDRLSRIRENLPREFKEKYKLVKFIDTEKIAETIAGSDLVISRSGINTVAELYYLKKPAILIPLPYGQNNEQLENARFLEKNGLCKILIQDKTAPEILYSQIVQFTDKLESIKQTAYENQKPAEDAAKKIVSFIQEAGKEKDK